MAFLSPTPVLRPARAGGVLLSERDRNIARCAVESDLLVVGAGVLGRRAARLWREAFPESSVVCATRTKSKHEELRAEGFEAVVAEELKGTSAANVLFCAPPSKNEKYVQAVAEAAEMAKSRFLFTSSTGVYEDSEIVSENSALSNSMRAKRLRDAEQAALANSCGSVVRLGGLYDYDRGPHAIWLRNGVCSGGEDGMLNMLHYDDAASVAVAVLRNNDANGKIFLAVDGNPLTRMELIMAAQEHPLFDHFGPPQWGKGGHVKKIDCSWTKQQLGWSPKWSSFQTFMEADKEEIKKPVPGVKYGELDDDEIWAPMYRELYGRDTPDPVVVNRDGNAESVSLDGTTSKQTSDRLPKPTGSK